MPARKVRMPGATLHCELRGTGLVLLLIPGGNGDAGFYEPLAKALAGRFTVVTYDRRGFSRSPLDGPVPEERLRIDADDAQRLLELLGDGPAYVFGSSSGAVVALDLITRYPEWVRTVVVHEPPLVTLLPECDRYLTLFDEVHDTYRRQGVGQAMRKFSDGAGAGPPRSGTMEFWRMAKLMPRLRTNMRFWLDHELRQYPRYAPDVDALHKLTDRLVLAGGAASRDNFPYRPNTVLAQQLGTTVVDFPGGHAGYRPHAREFADRLSHVLT